jgi:hypothetical protein
MIAKVHRSLAEEGDASHRGVEVDCGSSIHTLKVEVLNRRCRMPLRHSPCRIVVVEVVIEATIAKAIHEFVIDSAQH